VKLIISPQSEGTQMLRNFFITGMSLLGSVDVIWFIFTVWRYAGAVCVVALWPSICLSVTSQYCTKTAIH